MPRRRWAYYRWLTWCMTVIAILMTIGMLVILLGLLGTGDLDMESARFGASYLLGSLAVSFLAFHVYRWLGRHEPPGEG